MNYYIYFIQAGEKGPIKIGVANNVANRLESLQTGNHEELRVIHSFQVSGKSKAFDFERQLHKYFRHKCIRREWFTVQTEMWWSQELNENNFSAILYRGPNGKRMIGKKFIEAVHEERAAESLDTAYLASTRGIY